MITEKDVQRRVEGLVVLLGWDWGDALSALPSESDEVLVELVGFLSTPNPDGSGVWAADSPNRYDILSRMGISAANRILWSRTR